MNTKIFVIVGVGVFLLLGGLAMPSQQTQRAETCVDSNYGADGCVESTYTVPNYGKSLSILLGLVLVLGGIGASYSLSDSEKGTTMTSPSITEQSENEEDPASVDTDVSMLHEQVQSKDDDRP